MKQEKSYPQNEINRVPQAALPEFINKLGRLLDENSEISVRIFSKVSLIKQAENKSERGAAAEGRDVNSAMDELWELSDRFERQIRTASDTLELLDEIV